MKDEELKFNFDVQRLSLLKLREPCVIKFIPDVLETGDASNE